MSIQIIPFHDGLIPEAGEILALRHQADRLIFPEFSPRYEDPATACEAVKVSLSRKHAGGFAAIQNGALSAYLIGDMVFDSVWGRSGWVRAAGCAYALETDVEILRDLYAALGERWVGYGIFAHYAQLPISDPALLHAWYSLSFGIEHIYALADLQALKPAAPAPQPGIELRKAGLEDREHIAGMADVIWRQQVKAPTWAIQVPEGVNENREVWGSQVVEPDVTVWLALRNGKASGIQGYWPAESALNASGDNLFIPENCAHMSLAGTLPEERGKGISTLLSKQVLWEARSQGYRYCDTDWRSTNLLASRFWPRQGYRPVVNRLVRRLDPRISWAKGM